MSEKSIINILFVGWENVGKSTTKQKFLAHETKKRKRKKKEKEKIYFTEVNSIWLSQLWFPFTNKNKPKNTQIKSQFPSIFSATKQKVKETPKKAIVWKALPSEIAQKHWHWRRNKL